MQQVSAATLSILDLSTNNVYKFLYQGSGVQYSYTVTFQYTVMVDILIVGGGGGSSTPNGASCESGGGGAGGMLYMVNKAIAAGTYTVAVGRGGPTATAGGDSFIKDYTSNYLVLDSILTVGYGGGVGTANAAGGAGGSGGGGGNDRQVPGAATQLNTFWNGTAYLPGGYSGGVSSGCCRGAGGGGASEPGGTILEGDGGTGRAVGITGQMTYYAGGGQGCKAAQGYTNIRGSLGGGGHGPSSHSGSDYTNGEPHTGGGGGGQCDCSAPIAAGPAGGSGIIVIKIKGICKACATGYATASTGAATVAECTVCDKGYWGDGVTCTRCPHMTNKAAVANTGPTTCLSYTPLVSYQFEDPNNLGLDSSGNDYHATLFNNPTASAAARKGTGSIYFSATGTQQYMTIPNTVDFSAIQKASGVTVSTWVYFDATSASDGRVFDFGGGTPGGNWLIQAQPSTNNMYWYTFPSSSGYYYTYNLAPFTGRWLHIVFSIQSSSFAAKPNGWKGWVNGVLICDHCFAYGMMSISQASRINYIAKSWWSTQSTVAYFDDFRVYNYAFTQFDMEQHYLPLFNPTACLPDAYNPNSAYLFYPTLIANKGYPGVSDPNNGAVAPIAAWDDALRQAVSRDKYATIVRVCYDCAASNWLTIYKRVLPVDTDWSISKNYLTAWVTDRNTQQVHYSMFTSESDYLASRPSVIIIPTTVSVTFIDSGNAYIRFTYAGSGTSTTYSITVTSDIVADILIVGGGGAGGGRQGAGGGGGGVMYLTDQKVAAGTYTVVVGNGGAGTNAESTPGGKGYASSFGSFTAYGGGGGAGFSGHALNFNAASYVIASGGGGRGWGTSASNNGYSNGGTSNGNTLLTQNGGVGYSGGRGWQNYGGDAATTSTIYALLGGGGGGAGGVGQDATPTSNVAPTYVGKAGDGGPGVEVNIIGGSANFYGGGGGGGSWVSSGDLTGAGGVGGGGAGRNNAVGTAGTAHTGGGGGGGGFANQIGGAGGSGVVILRYKTSIVAVSQTVVNEATDVTKKAAYYLLSDCVKCAEGFQTGVTTATSSAECKWFDFSAPWCPVGSYSADGFSKALTGTASASSTYSGFSSTVVLSDTTTWGEPDSNFWSSTNVASQWWSVDFGLVQSVRFVRVWTRMDSPGNNRGDHQALVGNSTTVTDNRRCGIYQRFSSIYMTTTSTCEQYGNRGFIYQSDAANTWLHAGRVRFYGGCTPCPDGTTSVGEGRVDVGQCYVSTLQPPVNPANHYSVNGRMWEVQVGATVVANTVLSASTAA
eukprot:764221-Hanusia_phi.AAC.1